MGREHEADTRWRAQELYCVDRLSYARVAELTGVSATTLKAWGERYRWRGKREELAEIESELRVGAIKSRKNALDMLLAAEGGREASQLAFAVASLESLALKRQELAAAGKLDTAPSPSLVPVPTLTSRADAVTALRTVVEHKLGLALADPGRINAATVQDVKKCLDLVAELEAGLPDQAAQVGQAGRVGEGAGADDRAGGKPRGLSPEHTEAIRAILEA